MTSTESSAHNIVSNCSCVQLFLRTFSHVFVQKRTCLCSERFQYEEKTNRNNKVTISIQMSQHVTGYGMVWCGLRVVTIYDVFMAGKIISVFSCRYDCAAV